MTLLNENRQSPDAGLYFVATPIGTASDITLRALDLLQNVDILAAEDTRNTRRLLDIHGVKLEGRPLIPYHDHNGAQQRPRLLAALAEGKTVAYVSDAGTPLLADPGYSLARAVIDAGLSVFAAPGASALLAALSVAGLPTDRFYFAGFLPPKTKARRDLLASYGAIPGTLVFYESPKRLGKTLADMADVLGSRSAAVCRELTKKFEETRRGSLSDLAEIYATLTPKGEIVIVVGPGEKPAADEDEILNALATTIATGTSKRDAIAEVAATFDLPRKQVYQLALTLKPR